MASMNILAPTHVTSISFNDSGGSEGNAKNNNDSTSATASTTTLIDDISQWPALSPSKISSLAMEKLDNIDDDWEMTDHSQSSSKNNTVNILHHCQSSPNFETVLENDEEAVLIEIDNREREEDGGTSITSSSIVMVSGPASVLSESVWCGASPSKVSFRDVILKEKQVQSNCTGTEEKRQVQQKKKTKFVVTPIQRCAKSTGDLKSLARIAEGHGEADYNMYDDGGGGGGGGGGIILGETDAELFYNRKAQGRLGRTNGKKIRPDEKKRLQMTMAKKNDQRQRQLAGKSRKNG